MTLTEKQRLVVQAPVDERQFVSAPAGTGKTHVLVARVAELIDTHNLAAGDEVIVLSFSRAAVEELRTRTVAQGGDGGFVSAVTFDAFASLLLATASTDPAWETLAYDDRIRAATALLQNPDAEVSPLALCRHVLVDECQDLVGPRVEFVMALLERADCGFTIFGDMAQAIYDYQSDGRGPQELLEQLEQRFGAAIVHRQLCQNFRAVGPLAEQALQFGDELRSPASDPLEVADRLHTFVLTLPFLDDLDLATRMLRRADTTRTAILCRTNAEALLISRRLHELEIPHRLQRRADDRAAVRWIADCFADVDHRKVARSVVADLLDHCCVEEGGSAELWPVLRRLDPRREDVLDLGRIAECIRSGALPQRLIAQSDTRVVVSTIHRAKGLEFDRVILCEPREHRDGDIASENRLLYVALTRSRSEILVLPRPDTSGFRPDKRTQRWVKRGFGPNMWKVHEVEVQGPDVHTADPVGTHLVSTDVTDTQTYLRENVQSGDPVELAFLEVGQRDPAPHYRIRHRERTIGVTSADFAEALGRILGARSRWPNRIEALHIELVATAAGNPTVGRNAGLGAAGLWRYPRLSGLGRLRFDAPASDEEE